MKAAVLPNLDKRGAREAVINLAEILKSEQIEAFLPEGMDFEGYAVLPEEQLYKTADIIIAIGGDGTIIRYAKRAAFEDKPVLGINAGRMGYLANIEQNELKLLSKLKRGEYFVERRMMLSAAVYDGSRRIGEYNALNDAVITSGYISKIIDVSVAVAGDSISYRADGLIISTPTGSTAYSMSAGGPIIDPLTQSMCITPICSHSLSAKPILLGAENTVRVKAFSKKRAEIFLSVDGRRVAQIRPYTEVVIRRSRQYAKLIRLNDRSFYKTLSVKFKDGSI